ncbi:hypothetical protein [Xanthomonas phage DMF5-T1]|nr:hypothetical protein [Xanthomonas phage DMF5-T1]
MKKLFVGCRVRILYSKGFPELGGQEGRIVGANPGITLQGTPADWAVAPDRWGSWSAPIWHEKAGNRFSPRSEQLEPIQPEGAQPSLYSMEQLMEGLTNQMEVTA